MCSTSGWTFWCKKGTVCLTAFPELNLRRLDCQEWWVGWSPDLGWGGGGAQIPRGAWCARTMRSLCLVSTSVLWPRTQNLTREISSASSVLRYFWSCIMWRMWNIFCFLEFLKLFGAVLLARWEFGVKLLGSGEMWRTQRQEWGGWNPEEGELGLVQVLFFLWLGSNPLLPGWN